MTAKIKARAVKKFRLFQPSHSRSHSGFHFIALIQFFTLFKSKKREHISVYPCAVERPITLLSKMLYSD
jgi:hypothetical protein